MKQFLGILSVCFLLVGCEEDGTNEELVHSYLTFENTDTTQSITVNFHATRTEYRLPRVIYDTESRSDWKEYAYYSEPAFEQTPAKGRKFYRAKLENLVPGQTYYFRVGDPSREWSDEKKFKTPIGGDSLRFIVGGDMATRADTRRLMRHAAALNPDFAVIGGDIAYANGDLGKLYLWDDWLKSWGQIMVDSEGHSIPIIAAIGNHETQSPVRSAPMFFPIFAQNARTAYFRRDFGDERSIVILDTGHIHDIGGEQTDWLEQALADTNDRDFVFAAYHVPLYPAHRLFLNPASVLGRQHWLPFFDQYRLTAAFEHHDHVMKRTKPLCGNEVCNDGGVVYFGDGAFGKGGRSTGPRWYLERFEEKIHFWFVEVDETAIFRAFDRNGEVFDEVSLDAR